MTKNIRICTIGGGSGMPIVNKSLVAAGYHNVYSIVTTFDSGGDTGRMRTDERGKLLAFSDYWRSLMSLWKDGKKKLAWEEILRFRDGRGRNFGNIFVQFLSEYSGSLSEVDDMFERLTGANINGKVIPVALRPANVCFETKSGKRYVGENHLDDLRMSADKVVEIWLEPKVEANEKAVEMVQSAELIIICPGSMYGSVITNFLPQGMVEAYQKSRAKRVLLTNIMSVANENDKYDQGDYVRVFEKYLKTKSPFDLVVMNKLEMTNPTVSKVLRYYEMEHSCPILLNKKTREYKAIEVDLSVIETKNYRIRHSEIKLSKLFTKLRQLLW